MASLSLKVADLPGYAGKALGSSEWLTITQDQVNAFADVTQDRQWIHVDVERAKTESPFGGPVAHGYFTLSLFSHFMAEIWSIEDAAMALNYGLNKVRFPSPVAVGSRIRAHAAVQSVEEVPGGLQLVVAVTVEIDGVEKPACAAESVFRVYG